MSTKVVPAKPATVDKRIGTMMIHPVFGEILITDVRVVPDRTIAYYEGSFCNMNILTERRKK